jgi:hypothetical protein
MIIDNIESIHYFEINDDFSFVVKGRFVTPSASLEFGGKKSRHAEEYDVTSIKTTPRRFLL